MWHYVILTLSRELQDASVLPDLLRDMIHHAVYVGCDELLLETFKSRSMSQVEKVFHPLLSLFVYIFFVVASSTRYCIIILPWCGLHLHTVNQSRSAGREQESPTGIHK